MPAGIYIHIPFCKSRCSYCDFATDVWRNDEAVERYVVALAEEISNFKFQISNSKTAEIDSIYFGGGTPSLLSPAQLDRILKIVNDKFNLATDIEITLEMNPATATAKKLAAFRSSGVNRASFGVQTFDDRALKLLARGHDADDARTTFKMLRDAGFDNVSFDLIAGLPGQTLDAWKENLDEAIAISPEHLSLYLLEIHEGTPLAEQVRSKRQPQPDSELAVEMYELMLESLADAGYLQYEISNFAKPGFGSRHNSKYWTLDPVFGFGVSAHSFDGHQRYANERDTAKYVALLERNESPEVMREDIDEASEFIFLGLRLEKGISLLEYKQRFCRDLKNQFSNEIAHLIGDDLIRENENRLQLTHRGKLYSNEVFAVFV